MSWTKSSAVANCSKDSSFKSSASLHKYVCIELKACNVVGIRRQMPSVKMVLSSGVSLKSLHSLGAKLHQCNQANKNITAWQNVTAYSYSPKLVSLKWHKMGVETGAIISSAQQQLEAPVQLHWPAEYSSNLKKRLLGAYCSVLVYFMV